jgi:hypothetical protein
MSVAFQHGASDRRAKLAAQGFLRLLPRATDDRGMIGANFRNLDPNEPLASTGVALVWWRVNCFRDSTLPHCTLTEGDTEIAPPGEIVDPGATVRSPARCVLSNMMGDR